MSNRTFPEYWVWNHPDPAVPITILVQMERFACARFWERQTQEWGPIDMDDLAETIDYHHFVNGAQFEEITEAEAEEVKARLDSLDK